MHLLVESATSQGREPAAKKSESLSRGKRVPKQKDWARAIDELRREEQVELTSDLQGVVEGSHRQMFKREADETGILEGSRLVKHQGRYYLLMISHVYELGRHRREVCYRADNLAGPWEKKINLY